MKEILLRMHTTTHGILQQAIKYCYSNNMLDICYIYLEVFKSSIYFKDVINSCNILIRQREGIIILTLKINKMQLKFIIGLSPGHTN